MNRRHRERFALIALAMWSPYDRPEVPEEISSDRATALRKWRGQDDDDAAKPADAFTLRKGDSKC